MSDTRQDRIDQLLQAALEREPRDRDAFLAAACAGDPALRREVELLLERSVPRPGAAPTPTAAAEPSVDHGSLIGRQLGTYRVQALLGAGGMGEVYRAHDARLGRDVAIKILPRDFTADRARLARFEREARMLAALNHPNIATIHGVEDSGGTTALVMELIEGETLSDRIERAHGRRRGHSGQATPQAKAGGLPLDEALTIARQIAGALEAAHDKGIVHRDLKPANIKVTPAGAVKVLDFGLAKTVGGETAGGEVSQARTLSSDGTDAGLIVGTAAYMSPEQARGLPVDKRTDIWAFGCVLYEMLSGRTTFGGDTIPDILAAVLDRQPDWDRLPETVPRPVAHLLRRCLEKDSRRRLRDIGEARVTLEDALVSPAPDRPAELRPAAVTRRTAISAVVGGVVGAAAAGGFAIRRRGDGGTPRALKRFAIVLPDGHFFNPSFNKMVALSQDGNHVACNAVPVSGPRRLQIRALVELEWKTLEGVHGAIPFFSPQPPWMGYMAVDGSGLLRKVSLTGGAPVTIAKGFAAGIAGATWADTDTIYLVPDNPGALARMPASGGQPREFARIDFEKGERLHKFPHALPGGKAVLLTVATADAESFDDAHIAVVSVATGRRKVLVEGGTAPRYSPSGHLVYGRNGNLLAVRFDPDRLEITGQPATVLEGVLMSRNTGVANFDISASGDLVYVPGKADGGARVLALVDRTGKAEPLALPPRSYLHPRISPDGRKLAIEIEGSSHDLYIYDFASGVLSNLTADGTSHWPVWSPDGRSIGYRSGPMGRFQLWQVSADRSQAARRVPATGSSQSAESYSPDGRVLAYTIAELGAPTKVAVVALEGDAKPKPLDDTRFAQGSPKFSPDGRWLAFCSNESGRPQVYVQAMPGPGPRIQVSSEGGTDPVWRRTAGELFYRNGDSMMAVKVSTSGTFSAGRPQELWKGPYSHGMSSSCGAPGLTSSNYDVMPDGTRFLMIKDADQDTTSRQIVLVQGWAGGLKL